MNGLKQKPSIAESIMWAKSLLIHLGADGLNEDNQSNIDWTLNVLLKNKRDIEKVKKTRYLANV